MKAASTDLTYADIRTAVDRIGGAVRPITVCPLDPGTIQSSGVGQCQVWLALEFMQHTGSVQLRGVQNLIDTHREDDTLPAAGVAIADGGNVGLAVAWAAKMTGIEATVFVPSQTPVSRVEQLRRLGADVLCVGARADAGAACRTYADASGALPINPDGDPLMAAGAGTLMDEIHQRIPYLDTITVAVGNGNTFAGIATAADHYGVRTVAVEPENCRALNAAITAGRVVDVQVDSIAADSHGTRHVSSIALRAAQQFEVRSILVGDADIVTARRELWNRWHLAVEHDAATALAGLTTGTYRPSPGERVCVVLSGANTTLSDLAN